MGKGRVDQKGKKSAIEMQRIYKREGISCGWLGLSRCTSGLIRFVHDRDGGGSGGGHKRRTCIRLYTYMYIYYVSVLSMDKKS